MEQTFCLIHECRRNAFFLDFKSKIQTWIGIRISGLQISSLAIYYLSYLGSIDGTGLNLSLESNAMGSCDTLTSKLTLAFFFNVLNQIDKYMQTYNLCLDKLQLHISREKFELESRFEPQTSRSLA